METYYFLIPLSLIMGGTALLAFFWTLRTRQYEDLKGASERILFDPEEDALSPDDGDEGNEHVKGTADKPHDL